MYFKTTQYKEILCQHRTNSNGKIAQEILLNKITLKETKAEVLAPHEQI